MPSLYRTDRSRLLTIFTTWPFVLALAVLLLNDGFLKQAWPGLVTGKLSDFAGLAVVALPGFAAFPRHARATYLAIGGAFLWWKSPASDAFISYMNEMLPMTLGRTVDFGDLIALTILPLCSRFAAGKPRSAVGSHTLRRWLLPPVLVAALFGVMATSQAPAIRKDFEVRALESSAPFPRDGIVEAITEVARSRGLKFSKPNPPHWEGAFEGRGVLLTYTFKGTAEIAVGIQPSGGSISYKESKAEKLRDEIKKTLSLRYNGLEFVDPPPPR
jgi:hypothetical protein